MAFIQNVYFNNDSYCNECPITPMQLSWSLLNFEEIGLVG